MLFDASEIHSSFRRSDEESTADVGASGSVGRLRKNGVVDSGGEVFILGKVGISPWTSDCWFLSLISLI